MYRRIATIPGYIPVQGSRYLSLWTSLVRILYAYDIAHFLFAGTIATPEPLMRNIHSHHTTDILIPALAPTFAPLSSSSATTGTTSLLSLSSQGSLAVSTRRFSEPGLYPILHFPNKCRPAFQFRSSFRPHADLSSTLSTRSSPTAGPNPVSFLPIESLSQGAGSTSPLITLGGFPISVASIQATVSLQPPGKSPANIHRNTLSTGAIIGISLTFVAVVITLMIMVSIRRHLRRHQYGTNVELHMVSSTAPGIRTGAPRARLRKGHCAKEKIIPIGAGAGTQIDEQRVPDDDVEGSAEEPVPERARSSGSQQMSRADGGTVALLAPIHKWQSQIPGTRASGLSDDLPPGYTA
ncbi:hypothetical protein B0H13DRAFT_1883135 [Mycena leptocephala]|nr:hypothetical protein B0H13DRAFT_1883135 [Mycena leptocephala]